MSYLKTIEWEIVPQESPKIIRNCSKCGCKAHFINSGNFRVNANGNHIDVWLIYQCEKCKTTYNMTIYTRINPSKLERDEYEKYLANDYELAMQYGFDAQVLQKNKLEVDWEGVKYKVISKEFDKDIEKMNNCTTCKRQVRIRIKCKYPIKIRLDKIISEQFEVSRNKVKKLIEEGMIYSMQKENISKAAVFDGLEIVVNSIELTGEMEMDNAC